MAARRKLQSEIDICLKKVDEGLEYFHELWDKAHKLWDKVEQREKIAAELKKEIKKLQRHREQVKNWVTKHPDLLNKEPLIEARRKIEKEMERFKNFEKEVKTKTYSKVGLSLKRNRISPEQQEAIDWIQEQREALKSQQQELEEQLDKLQRKNRKKKSSQQSETEEILTKRIDKHKWHQVQMRDLSKRIEKGRVDPRQLDALKDDIQYYVEEAAADEEFWDNDLLYDGVEELPVPEEQEPQLEEEEEIERSPSPPPVKKKKEKRKKEKKLKKAKRKKKTKESSTPIATPIVPASTPIAATPINSTPIPKIRTPLVNNEPDMSKINSSVSPAINSISPATTVSMSQSEPVPIFLSGSQSQTPTQKPLNGTSSIPPAAMTPTRQDGVRIPDFQSIMLEEEARQKKQNELQRKQRENGTPVIKEESQNVWAAGTPFNKFSLNSSHDQRVTTPSFSLNPIHDQRVKTPINTPNINERNPMAAIGSIEDPSVRMQVLLPTPPSSFVESSLPNILPQHAAPSNQSIPPFLGEVQDHYLEQLKKVNYAFNKMPPASSKRCYFPRNPVRVPESFPMNPQPRCEDPEFVSNYDVDTLFFMFHYSQGTHQQFLAAQELKKRSWRYHKKFLTWFQRHTEPKVATNQFEQGAYIYFDYESSWCQRVKNDFRFEYQYLEDS